ncbi:hypothetical protein [Halotia branconii]|uniref:Uncharacterized protein n=1 Tax=Halotia branconii CENA392 TaxID=1539056 RepID=A0AAJ6NUX7_9CYAN|nr:hypothetical protein [Halotia branconii]WGV26978.1 hypothetical protein QI031_05640 [Halotia branconii CENA392]
MSIWKYVTLALLLILTNTVVLSVFPFICRNYDGHIVCILSINRSAKNYWEYRASVSVDGVKNPKEVYNCRERVKVKQDKTVVSFRQNDPSELVCSLFNKS